MKEYNQEKDQRQDTGMMEGTDVGAGKQKFLLQRKRLPLIAACCCIMLVLVFAGFKGVGYLVIGTTLTGREREEADAYIASLARHGTELAGLVEGGDGNTYYEIREIDDFEQYMLNKPGNTVVYPGAVIRGDSLMQGSANYTLVTQKRTPMIFSCSLGGKTAQVKDVTYGIANKAVEKLYKGEDLKYSQSSEYNYYSGKDGRYLGGGVKAGGQVKDIEGEAGVAASSSESSSTIDVVFTETYFTVTAEPLASATEYFRLKSIEDLEVLGDYQPAYVSSVNYGRILIASITANMSEMDLMAEVSAGVQKPELNAGGQASGFINYLSTSENFTYQLYSYGGDSSNNVKPIDPDDAEIIVDNSLVNPVPVAYQLNYISDNSPVPAKTIRSVDRILRENARLVTITLEGKEMANAFQIKDMEDIGAVLGSDYITINSNGQTSDNIKFIWDLSRPESKLTAVLDNDQFDFSLQKVQEEQENQEEQEEQEEQEILQTGAGIKVWEKEGFLKGLFGVTDKC